MIRIVIALALVGCVQRPAPVAPAQPAPEAPKPVAVTPAPAPPVNAVCEAFKGVNGSAGCTPHHTDVGELHIHTATVTLGEQRFACRTDLSMLGVLCGDTIVVKQQPPPPTVDATYTNASGKTKTPAKKPKK